MGSFGRIAAVSVIVSLVAGCTGLLQNIDHDARMDAARAGNLMSKTAKGDNRETDDDGVVVKDELWLSGNTLKIPPKGTLPTLFTEPASFDGTVDSLRAFSERVTRLAHIPAKVTTDADQAAAHATQPVTDSSSAAQTGTPGVPPLPLGLLQPPRGGAAAGPAVAAEPTPVHIVYPHGTLRGLLDTAAARFNVYWKYADGTIVFYYTDTRVFQVTAIPGDSTLDTSVVSGSSSSGSSSGGGSGGGGGGAGGGAASGGGSSGGGGAGPSVSSDNSTNIAMNAQLSVYSSLTSAIKTMLSPSGSVVGSPATGSISVTDTPDVLDRVGQFMEQQNKVLARQVLVNVTVLSVTLSADDSYGIDWNAVYQALGTKFNITNAFTGLSGVGDLSATVITPSSRASATNAMVSALSDQGTVRRKTSASITTLNDQPVPVQVAEQQSYLAQVSTTNTANVGSQTALTPGTVTTGLNLTLLPHILDDGTVMMQFYTNISSLVGLATFGGSSNGGESIQLPTVDTRNFLQRIAIKSGQTLVISGYEGVADHGTRQGIGTPGNYALGGGYNASHSREIIVILISPVAMNGA